MSGIRYGIALSILLGAVPAISQTQDYSPGRRLEIAVESGSATREQHLELARVYIDAGRYYEARKIADKVLSTQSTDVEAKQIRDRAVAGLRESGNRDVAVIEERARAANATDADRAALADGYFAAGRYREAAAAYAGLPASSVSPESRLRHARSLSWARQTDEAEALYAELLRESPTPELELEYGRLLSWMGAQELAIQNLTRANDRLRSEESIIALANSYSWNENRERAIELLTEYMASHPDAPEASRLLEELRTSRQLELERLDRRIAADSYNLALRMERARLLYEMNEYGEARRTLRFVGENSTGEVEGLAELERKLDAYRAEEMARLDERRAALGSMASQAENGAPSPRHEEMLSLAKAYAAIEAYDQSTGLYEQYLSAYPDDVDVRIRYARVLSWDRRYDDAQFQYERILRQYPDRADLRLEYAQTLSWQRDYTQAMREFWGLTDLSGNPRSRLYPDVAARAYFNRGQIYRWFGWSDHAQREQNAALQFDSTYEPSMRELDRIRMGRTSGAVEARYSQSEDSNDFRLRRADLMGETWLNPRLAVSAALGRHNFERGSESVDATALSAGARYRHTDRFLTRGRVGANLYGNGVGTHPFFGLGAEYLPNIQSRVALDYNRYDLVYDVFTLDSLGGTPGNSLSLDPVSIDDFRLHYDYRSGGRWSWLADASHGFLSDDNSRTGLRGLISYTLFREPFVAIKADGRYLSYDFRTRRYWSPDDYRSGGVILQVGQNLEHFEWSAEARVGRSWERNRSSDSRSYGVNVTVPVNEVIDIVGDYGYGKSGRFDSVFANDTSDFTNYWRRNWFVGVRVKNLFSRRDSSDRAEPYYYDNRVLTTSPVIPPVGENR